MTHKHISLSHALIVASSLAFAACSQRVFQVVAADGAVEDDDGGLVDAADAFVLQLPDAPVATDAPANPGGCNGGGCDAGDAGPQAVCGNGKLEDGESCDDGNARPGDGCSGLCRVEPNFTCPTVGSPCRSTIVCGDGNVQGGEACDDMNAASGDGCSDTCQVEAGYACAMPGKPCTRVPTARCGDGVVNQGETCDDGNATPGDGCSAVCRLEPAYTCPVPNQKCIKDEYCGDGLLNGIEQCDDGNAAPGDGCTGACRIEQYFECKVPGQACTTTIVCGDGKVIGDEACDDNNKMGGDGCSANCKQIEPGYSCPTTAGVGGACILVPKDICGDGRLSYGEYCDDGNMVAGDGCTADCHVESGYACPKAGQRCALVEWCGDGQLSVANGEQCDDHNTVGGDGCSGQCVIEANFACPQPGQPCQSTVICSDRRVSGGETCDDGNLVSGDGCSGLCAVEAGWTCQLGNACRPAQCGDGIKVGSEQCDDHNANPGDGCSATCTLEVPGPAEENGWVCPTPGQPCVRTVCGNGVAEGSEQCDDGNNNMGDGCTPFCRKEPVCPAAGGSCSTSCGDGLLLPVDISAGQECDDGNTLSGDGCSSTCKIEPGYRCTSTATTQDPLLLPIILRDFKAAGDPNGHPDFEQYVGSVTGIVETMLGTNGKPIHVAADTSVTTNNNPGVSTDYFSYWYADNAQYNKTIHDVLSFTRLGSGVYQYSNSDFFPLDGKGWGNYQPYMNGLHNFHFTSEVRYWFEYGGSEQLDFTGDDDVWVFINKKLAVDLGGVHGAEDASVILDATNGTGQVCDLLNNCGARRTVDFGLQKGKVYEIVVFQAERHITQSNYRLTLSNFAGTHSQCATVCGDGIVTSNEACDLGTAQNTGAYGTCHADCTLPPRCGDAVVQPNEQCDNGLNVSTYGGTAKLCAPGCVFAAYCGDGKVDSANGEACDQGADNGKGYGFCTATCQLGPRCGDGIVTDAEECDDAANNGTSGSACMATCKKKCGNGMPDAREQCDDGKAANIGGYGKCNMDCTLGPRCGDGVKNASETCDDGKNDGSYGACAPMCVLGPRCGDSVVQSTAGEICDLGTANQASAYGKSKCTNRCRIAPYCGDKTVDVMFGEKCDDGVNSGQPGSCTADCSAAVPLPSCGDGTVQAPEQCDDGAANGTQGSACDGTCHRKCGNGFKDAGEQCDDGKNDGTYGTCQANCTLAAYCGDGIKNGSEPCDLGQANEANPYGKDKCSMSCLNAPYCGDGRIQSTFGEVCDSSPGCSNMCRATIIP